MSQETKPSPDDAEIVALIPNYEQLSEDDIIQASAQLTPEEREAVRKYEAAHLNRPRVIAVLA